jgi:hypothetical protein
MSCFLNVFKIGKDLFLGENLFDSIELLSSFRLFAKEAGVFIPLLEPKASIFLPPIILLLSASPMEVYVQLVFFFQGGWVYRECLCLDLVLFQGVLHFQSLMEGGFESFGPVFKSLFKFPHLFFPNEKG